MIFDYSSPQAVAHAIVALLPEVGSSRIATEKFNGIKSEANKQGTWNLALAMAIEQLEEGLSNGNNQLA